MTRFEDVMKTVLKWEGGFVDNPFDNGGPTNFGITHAVLAQWRGVAGVTRLDVKNMKPDEAIAIFKSRYWDQVKGDALPDPIDLIVMDGAVNHGVVTMSRILQEAIGASIDGKIGVNTIASVTASTGTKKALLNLASDLADARKHRYVSHEDAAHFLKGWRNRLNDVMSAALAPHAVSWTFGTGFSDVPGISPVEETPASTIPAAIIDDSDLQAALTSFGLYSGDIDGLFGPRSAVALDDFLTRRSAAISGNWHLWALARRKIALGQYICADIGIDIGRIDGLFGPQTKFAFEEFNRRSYGLSAETWRDELDALPPPAEGSVAPVWPRQSDVPTFFGALGAGCTLVPLKRLNLPFKMKLAWNLNTEIDGFKVHERVYDSAAKAFDAVLAHYGESGVEDLGINLFGGCTSCRKKKGGTTWSMHAWSIAIDFDPARNELNWNHNRARLAKPDAVRFWEIWEAEGWLSLGRARDFDWMHVQAARL